MTNNQLNRERLEKIKSWRETYGAGSNVMLPAEEAEELARIALAAMDSEPVAWTWHYREQWHVTNDKCRAEFVATDGDVAVLPLYRHAQPASEKYNIGDATMRHIFTPTGMTNVSDMQAVFDRVEAVLVGMNQPAPVVPEEATPDSIEILASARRRDHAVFQWDEDQRNAAADSWNACRATMLQGKADGPLTNEGTIQALNSPVIPDRWIPVSERVPETDGNYWGWWSESKRQGPVWFIKSELQAQFQSSEITHWMPLPADPQEVKSES